MSSELSGELNRRFAAAAEVAAAYPPLPETTPADIALRGASGETISSAEIVVSPDNSAALIEADKPPVSFESPDLNKAKDSASPHHELLQKGFRTTQRVERLRAYVAAGGEVTNAA